jgi:hypothetical protein
VTATRAGSFGVIGALLAAWLAGIPQPVTYTWVTGPPATGQAYPRSITPSRRRHT